MRKMAKWGALGLVPAVLVAGVVVAAPRGEQSRRPVERSTPRDVDVARNLDLFRVDVQRPAVSPRIDGGLNVALRLDRDTRLELRPVSVRARSFRVRVQGPDGVLRVAQAEAPRTYRGTLAGRPDTVVAASRRDGRLRATVRLEDRSLWHVQPAAAEGEDYAVYRGEDVRPIEGVCGAGAPMPRLALGEAEAPRLTLRRHAAAAATTGTDAADPGAPAPAAAAGAVTTALVAFDTDVEYVLSNGGDVQATIDDIESIVNAVDAIYRDEVGIGYLIGDIIVRANEPDPYNTTEYFALLQQFRNQWLVNQTGVQRDIAHFMTGKNIDGATIGAAWEGTICTGSTLAFGFSQTKYSNNFANRVALTAHEFGHSWNVIGHCNGQSDCAIMCATIGSCSGSLTTFSNSSAAAIMAHRDSVSCLGDTVGACCLGDGSCEPVVTAATCTVVLDGTYLGNGTACDETACVVTCDGDIDGNGAVDLKDVLEVINNWETTDADADLDGSGLVDVDDLMIVLNAWGSCSGLLE